MIEFLSSPTFRRIIYGLLGVLLPIVNKRLGWELSDAQVGEALLALVALIASSTFNQAHARGTEAAVAVAEAKAAGPVPPRP